MHDNTRRFVIMVCSIRYAFELAKAPKKIFGNIAILTVLVK